MKYHENLNLIFYPLKSVKNTRLSLSFSEYYIVQGLSVLYPLLYLSSFPPGYSAEAGTDVESVAMRTPEKQAGMWPSLRERKLTLADATG